MTLNKIEQAGQKFFTKEELEEINSKIQAHQETIDEEIKNYGSAEDPEPLSFYQAFLDVWDSAENCLMDTDDKKWKTQARKDIKRCLEFAILIGTYKYISDQEYKDVYIYPASAKAKSFPKLNEKYTDFVGHPINHFN